MQKCDKCPLAQQPGLNSNRMLGIGNPQASIVVVGGKPSKLDDMKGHPFCGDVETFLVDVFKKAGLDDPLSSTFLTYTTKCFQQNSKDTLLSKKASKTCKDTWLVREINLIKPKVVITLGNEPYEAITGVSSGVEKSRGSVSEVKFGDVTFFLVPTYAPYYAMNQRKAIQDQMIFDIKRALQVLDGNVEGFTEEKLNSLKHIFINNISSFDDMISKIYKTKILAVDIETRGLDPYKQYEDGYPLVSIQFSCEEGESFFLPWANKEWVTLDNPEGFYWTKFFRDEIQLKLKRLLEDWDNELTLIGHNFKFDSKWIWKYLNIEPQLDYDTMVMSSLLGKDTSNGLKKLCWEYTNLGGYEKNQNTFTSSLPTEQQWDMWYYPSSVLVPYGCIDSDVTLRVFNKLNEMMGPDRYVLNSIIIKASRAFTAIEHDGILIDTDYLKDLEISLDSESHSLEESFRSEMSIPIVQLEEKLYKESLGKSGKPLKNKPRSFMLSSSDHVRRLLYEELNIPINDRYRSKKTGDASTGNPALKALSVKYPFVQKIIDWRKVAKLKSGFVDSYPKFIDIENKIHPTYNVVQYQDESGDSFGTVTGRSSCSNPNLQQVPSRGDGKKVKKLFLPDCSEHLFVDIDFAGIEMRVAAMWCQDPKMKEFFNIPNSDFHRQSAALAFNIKEEEVTTAQRHFAKTMNFCVPMSTQALTKDGFKSFDDLNEGDLVFALDPVDKKLKLTPIISKMKFENKDLIELKNNHFSVITTPEHRWFGKQRHATTKNGENIHFFTEEFFSTESISSEHTLYLSGEAETSTNPNISLEECELIGWILGDGSIIKSNYLGAPSQSKGKKVGFSLWVFQSRNKISHYNRLKKLLNNFPYREYKSKSSTNLVSKFLFPPNFARDLWLRANLNNEDYVKFVLSLSKEQRNRFLEGFFLAEGFIDKRGKKIISQNYGEKFKAVQLAVFLSGYYPLVQDHRAKSYIYKKLKNSINHNYNIRYGKPYVTGQRLKKKALGKADVWCIQTQLGTWVMKQDNTICSTGNCVLYGGSAKKVSEIIGCSIKESEDFIFKYFKAFPGLKDWINSQHKFVTQNLYVKSFFGRIRHLPDANSSDEFKRDAALKRALNCVDAETEILTVSGWKYYNEITEGTLILTKEPFSNNLEWNPIEKLNIVYDYTGKLISIESKSFSALTTPEHRWLVYDNSSGMNKDKFITSEALSVYGHSRIHRTGKYVKEDIFYSNDFVELCGWILTDGSLRIAKGKKSPRAYICQSLRANKEKCIKIEVLLQKLGCLKSIYIRKRTQEKIYNLCINTAKELYSLFPKRILTPEFIMKLSKDQAILLMNTLLLGDGTSNIKLKKEHHSEKRVFSCKTKEQADMFQFVCFLAGFATTAGYRDISKYIPKSLKLNNIPKQTGIWLVNVLNRDKIQVLGKQKQEVTAEKVLVWCPSVKNSTFVARRKGTVYVTGNSPIQADASDLTFNALGRIYEYLKQFDHKNKMWPSRLRGSVHDSILLSVHKEDLAEIVTHIKYNIMESPNLPFIDNKGVSLRADVSVGENWGEQYDIEF